MGATPCTYWVCWVIQAWLGQGDWVWEGWSMGEFEFILSLSAYSTHPHFWVSSPTIRLPGPAHTYCEADLSLLLVQLRRQIWETELSPLSEDQDFLWGSAHHTERLPFFPPWVTLHTHEATQMSHTPLQTHANEICQSWPVSSDFIRCVQTSLSPF